VSDDSTAVQQGLLERAAAGDAEARRRLLELTRDHLSGHARRLLHGRYDLGRMACIASSRIRMRRSFSARSAALDLARVSCDCSSG